MLDLEEPTRVLHRHPDWVFGPAAGYEREGDVPNAVFPCGLVHDEASGDRPPLLRRRGYLDLPRDDPSATSSSTPS